MDGGSFSKFGREILWWTKPCASRETAKTLWVIGGHLQHFYNLPPGNGCFNSMYIYSELQWHYFCTLQIFNDSIFTNIYHLDCWVIKWVILFLQSPNVSASRALRAWTGREPEKSSQNIVKKWWTLSNWDLDLRIHLNFIEFEVFTIFIRLKFSFRVPLSQYSASAAKIPRFRCPTASAAASLHQQQSEQNHTKWRDQC